MRWIFVLGFTGTLGKLLYIHFYKTKCFRLSTVGFDKWFSWIVSLSFHEKLLKNHRWFTTKINCTFHVWENALFNSALYAMNEAGCLISGLFGFARNLTDLVNDETGIIQDLFSNNQNESAVDENDVEWIKFPFYNLTLTSLLVFPSSK